MKTSPDRLLRLARAEAARASSHEAKLGATERGLRALSDRRRELVAALDSEGPLSELTRSSSLLRLTDVDRAIARGKQEAEVLRQKLLQSRSRHDALQERAISLYAKEERKTLDQEMQEVALAMRGTASGKHGMVD